MKKILFIMIMAAACLTGTVQAQSEGEMGVTVEATYMTKYLWHGVDMLDNMGAFAPSVNVDLGDSGFYVGVKYIIPIGGGNAYGEFPLSDLNEWDYWVGYKGQAMIGEATQLDYDLSYTYYDMGTIRPVSGVPAKLSGRDADMQELAFAVKMPNIFAIGVYPRYRVAYLFEPGGSEVGIFGFEHVFGMGYDFTVADVQMNSGLDFVYDAGAVYDTHEWSRMVAGLSATFDLGMGKLVPGVYYQWAFQDGTTGPVIDDDFYATVSYAIDF